MSDIVARLRQSVFVSTATANEAADEIERLEGIMSAKYRYTDDEIGQLNAEIERLRIIERLRAHPGIDDSVTVQFRNMVAQRHEAAAEIELLRAANDDLAHAVNWLRAEAEQLRAALAEAADLLDGDGEYPATARRWRALLAGNEQLEAG